MSKLLQNIELCKEIELNCSAKYKLQGYSKAGFQTGFWLHGLNILLDCGVYTTKQPKVIFITHAHADHSWLLPYIVTSRSPLTPVYIPLQAFKPIQTYQNSIRCLGSSSEENLGESVWSIQKCDPRTFNAGTKFRPMELKQIVVETIKCYHTCESIGYGFSTTVMKLKNEYANIDKKELMALKQANVSIQYEVETPQFVFFGDTNIDALLQHDEWKAYPVIIIECTGYDDILDINRQPDRSENSQYARGHIHINDIIPVMKQYSDKQFILIHSGGAIKSEKLMEIESVLINKLGINVVISR